jgi:PAS domain S-box-containing protein
VPSTIDLAARLSAILASQEEIFAAATDPAAVLRILVAKTELVTESDGAAIERLDGDELVYVAGSGRAAGREDLRLKVGASLSGAAISQKAMLRTDDVELDPRVDVAACRRMNIRSMIIAPLMRGGQPFGALKTVSTRARAFDDLDAYCVQILAGLASAALDLADQFRERGLSEERYRMLFERNIAGVFRTTRDGRILDCNDAFVRTLGYDSKEELLARESWDLYPQRADREQLLATLDRSGALTNVRLQLKRKDGSGVTGVVNVGFIPAGDGETHLLGTLVEE